MFKRKLLCDKSHRAVGEGEVGPAGMAATEDAGPILDCGKVAAGRHPVVDLLGSAERDIPARSVVRDESPPSPTGHGRCGIGRCGPDYRFLAFVFRIFVKALAEKERVTGAVSDIL